MGTRFSWAYLIRCDATDYIYPSPTKPKNQVRTTPLPNVIRQHAATTCRWLLHLDCSRSTELNGRYPATKSTAEISVPGHELPVGNTAQFE